MMRAELEKQGAYAVATSIRLSGSAIAIVDSQSGSHEQILLSDVSRSTRSHASGGGSGHRVHAVESSAPASDSMSAT